MTVGDFKDMIDPNIILDKDLPQREEKIEELKKITLKWTEICKSLEDVKNEFNNIQPLYDAVINSPTKETLAKLDEQIRTLEFAINLLDDDIDIDDIQHLTEVQTMEALNEELPQTMPLDPYETQQD